MKITNKLAMLALAVAVSGAISGCKKDDDDPAPAPSAPTAPAMNSSSSDPQVWFYVDGAAQHWIVDGVNDYDELSNTNYDLMSSPDKAVYTSKIYDASMNTFGSMAVALGTHSFSSPCDSSEISSFLTIASFNYSNDAQNGAYMQWTDNDGITWRTNGTQTGSSFKILDRTYSTINNVDYVSVHVAFTCTMYDLSGMLTPKSIRGEGVFTMENYN